MKGLLKIGIKLFIFCFLTAITQIGGVVFLLSLVISKKWQKELRYKNAVIFIWLYVVATFLIVPYVAPLFGREKVNHSDKIRPTNYMTVLLNRNYVRPELNVLLAQAEKGLVNSNVQINYLDANFPFIDNFPLLPHLSHNDGKKIDISLVYETDQKIISNKQRSVSGYGVFENPKDSEFDQPNRCISKGDIQYDFPKYLTFGEINEHLVFSEKGTKELINSILKSSAVGKLFIEPHLKNRMHLKDSRIRYHGCRAVRHDDHIHVQLK
tara:strand:+ start:136 stop:936 length:801 start_codon:yes stop_codon:yes gene_type:complete